MAETKDGSKFLEFVYEFYKSMKSHEISLVYEGEVTHQLTKAFTSLTESNMSKEEESGAVQRKVFHVMVECLQNISKHADEIPGYDSMYSGRGIFLVAKSEDEYTVTTGNAIENVRVPEMKKMLEHINSLEKDELNELYKKQMKEGRLSEKGGAGLGFIDIARKTGRKLVYDFLTIDEATSFFLMTSSISRTN